MINNTGYTLEELKRMGIEFGKIVTYKDMPAFKTTEQIKNETSSSLNKDNDDI